MSRPAPGRRRSPGWRPSLLVCGLIAIALHLLLLLWPAGPSGLVPVAGANRPLRVLELRTAALPTASEPVPAPPLPAEPAAAEQARQPPSAPPTPPEALADVPAEGSALAVEPDWWPREQLESGPRPLEPVLFDPVLAGTGLLPAGSNALLFVDDQGRVQRVEFGGTPLPPQAAAALRAAFEATPFEPGQRGGKPVRAKVRVAVDLVLDLNDGTR